MSGRQQVIFGREYPQSVDAVVIGSGIGGLVCANLLARGGMKVLLVERHHTLGGFCSTFRRKGFVFDAATHFYPLLGNPATMTGKLLAELEIPTQWIKMDPIDRFHLPGMPVFEVPADFAGYIRKLKDWFPDEAVALEQYFGDLRQAYLCGLLYYFKGIPNKGAQRLENFTIQQKLDESFRDPRLKTILLADSAHWGSLPDRTSYLFDAMLRMAYFEGNYYPRGGSQEFADDLGRSLEARGGKILKCASAERILIADGKVTGVRVRTVSRREPETFDFAAPVVVSNADAIHTFRDLVGEQHCGRSFLDGLQASTPTLPCFLTHIGLKGADPAELAAAAGYYWASLDPSDVAKDVFKVFIPTEYDPRVAPPGCQILIVQKLTPVQFDSTDWAAHKAEVEAAIMERLREILPGIDRQIVVKASATAMTSYRFTGNWQGAMLGWEMSPGHLGGSRLSNITAIENLYLAGHWTRPGGGITPVIVSAQLTAGRILGEVTKR